MEQLPRYQDLILPLLHILARAESQVSNKEIELEISKNLAIPDGLTKLIHAGARTELQYRLAWARTKAKNSGWVTSGKREFWSITDLGRHQIQGK